LPPDNRLGPPVWKSLLDRAFGEDRYFGKLKSEGWKGHYFRRAKFPRRWSIASRLRVREADWREAWPALLKKIQADELEVLKRGPSGDVLGGEVVLSGRSIPIVVKRPKRRFWHRYLTEIPRGTRPRRAWKKAWKLVARNVPTAWPMLLMERRKFGYVVDALFIFERIPGQTLSSPEWARYGVEKYHQLLRRTGRVLRKLEQAGLNLYDAKAENWMIRSDDMLGPTPMVIDVDGIRRIRQRGGLRRLLRSLRENSRVPFNANDALALALGYAPFANRQQLEELCGLGQPKASAGYIHGASGEARG
jgi:hypothetical protein